MKKLVLVAAIAALSTGCASVMTAENQSVDVNTSNNSAVQVTIEGKTITTPGSVVILRDGKDKVIRAKAEGCDTATPVGKSVTPVFFGNIFIGGALGSTTDASTGKMWDYADKVEIICAN